MTVRLLGLAGSLRAGSHHRHLLRAVRGLLPAGAELELYDYADVPLYDGDLARPEAVDRLLAAIGAADGLLIATPEYNHSVPGVLKNALDWASRPAYTSVLAGRPTGILAGSPGGIGGARAQQHLKNILLATGTPVYHGPEVAIAAIDKKLADDRVTDESTAAFLTRWFEGFVPWVERSRLAR